MSVASTSCRIVRDDAETRNPMRCDGEARPSGGVLSVIASEFTDLYASVHRYLLHRFFDRELAEELTARTFYTAAAHLARTQGDIRELRVWLLRVATNLANTHHRKKRLRNRLFERFARLRPTTTDSPSATGSVEERRLARVRGVVLTLRPVYQTPIVLRYYCHMTPRDIADVMGCRETTVRVRLSRAVKEMRRRLDAVDSTHSSRSS